MTYFRLTTARSNVSRARTAEKALTKTLNRRKLKWAKYFCESKTSMCPVKQNHRKSCVSRTPMQWYVCSSLGDVIYEPSFFPSQPIGVLFYDDWQVIDLLYFKRPWRGWALQGSIKCLNWRRDGKGVDWKDQNFILFSKSNFSDCR